MKQSEIISALLQGAVYLCITLAVASCGKVNDVEGKIGDGYHGCESTADTVVGARAVEQSRKPTREEKLEAEFKNIIFNSLAGEEDVRQMNQNISRLPNQQDALHLYDRLLDMAVSQQISTTNYSHRAAQYYKLWFAALYSFLGVQRRQGGDFAYWDKMFGFLGKYADEITAMEKSLPATDYLRWSGDDVEKGIYLHKFRGDFRTWVRVMRDFYFPELNKSLTEEQKADILRRFDELKRYMDTPPNFPFGRK